MTIETKKFSRRPFDVEAIRVNKSNMDGVAEWCKGEVVDVPATDTTRAERYIQVDVHSPANERQSRAFPGDYVLLLEGNASFKVYTQKAFNKNFVPSADDDASTKKESKATKPKTEEKPSNGIKPEAREALRKLTDGAQEAGAKVSEKMNEFSEKVKGSGNIDDRKDVTPSPAIEVPLSKEDADGLNKAAEVADRSVVMPEPELQVVNEPVANTTQPTLQATDPVVEPEKKRKFIQHAEDENPNS